MTPRIPRGTAGFTLIELLVMMLAVLIGISLSLRGPQPVSPRLVHRQAQAVRAEMLRALAEAEAYQGDAVFYVDPSVTGTRRGRFLALAGPPGTTRDTLPPDAGWIDLEEGVQWGWGDATTGPEGSPPVRMLGTIRCTYESACDLAGLPRATLYLTHARDPFNVEAIVLSQDGDVQLLHFHPASGRWAPGSP